MSKFNRFSRRADSNMLSAIRTVFIAARTVIFTPEHQARTVHDQVAAGLAGHTQALNPSLATELVAVKTILSSKISNSDALQLNFTDRLGLFACLMQFSMYDRSMPPYMKTDFKYVDDLYQRIVRQGTEHPLSLSQQLEIALDQTGGDAVEAVWRLWVMTRQYARWYDQESLFNMPQISSQQAIENMTKFHNSVLALKQHRPCRDQDTAGDNYYVWTHALAKLIYGKLSPWYALDAHFMRLALHFGTWLNHQIAHKISPQTVSSDHTSAARYGNAIGKQINSCLKINKRSQTR